MTIQDIMQGRKAVYRTTDDEGEHLHVERVIQPIPLDKPTAE